MVLILLVFEIINFVLLIRLLKKGNFVNVRNEVLYVPQKRTVKKVIQEDDSFE